MTKRLNYSFNKFALIFSMFVTILFTKSTSAQTYPVQTNISTSAPYLNYLSYYGDQNNHLQITLTYLDFSLPPELVRLRIRIEGPGYELYTNPNATIGQPFLLEAGMPLTITGIDLLPYLQQSNLINPSGVNLSNLPHGFTTICVDVIRQSASGQILSTNNCGFLPIQEYQPPQTFIPTCGDVLDTNMMFHTFTWTPPIPFPAGAGLELLYNFSIHQWADPNNNSALGGNSILIYEQTNLIAPTTQVSDFDMVFELGRTYVWKVTARVESNGMPISLIENGGVSAPCTFIYGEAPTLADVLGDGLEIQLFTSPSSERKGKAWWTVTDNTPNEGLSTFDAYYVEYRKQPTGNEGFEIPWFSKTLSSFEHFIYQLDPSTTYEVKVSGVIAGNVGDPTPVETFTTPDPRIYNCGESDVPYLPTNYTPLENATAGTQVKIGQFMMTMTEVIAVGSAGHYKGKGEIPIAFLAGAKAKVRFDDILIDTEYLVHEGRVDVITEGLANWLDEQYQQFIDPYFVEGTIDSAYVLDSVAWVVVDGVVHEFHFDPPNYPIIVNDESGNQYTIYPNGTIVVGTYLSVSESWAVAENGTARFGQNANETRGFDPMEHMEWYENYETMQLSDNTFYYVANKSMAKNESDKVNVQFPPNVTAMSFQLADGTPIGILDLEGVWDGNKPYLDSGLVKTLNIPSFSSSGKYEVHAFANNVKVGQLNIQVYSQKDKELIVVPLMVNLGISETDIENELKRTLGEANIEVDVTLESPWTDLTGTFTASTNISMPNNVGMLTKYSDDMRELRDAYFDQHPNAEKNKYYLFLVNGFDDPNELGYMVRGRSMGFVKADPNNQSQVLQTISHELGHGMGALEHSWKENGPSEGSTNNLMDYSSNPTNLTKAQWKELRDLNVVPSLWDDSEDGSSVSVNLAFLEPLSNQNSLTFVDLTGNIFSIPKTATQVEFSTLDRLVYQFLDPSVAESNTLAPIGTVLSFNLNGGNYAYTSGAYYKRNALGHALPIPSAKYIDTLTALDQPSKAITSFLSPSSEGLNVVYFHVDTSKVTQNTTDSWIIFDDRTKPLSSSLSSFVNHHKSNGSPNLEAVYNPINFGADATPLMVTKAIDTLIFITPFTILQASTAVYSVEYLVKYLLLCNYKKNQFNYLGECIKNDLEIRLTPNDFQYVVEGCTTCVDLSRNNYSTYKEQIQSHFQQAIVSAIELVDQTSYAELDSLVINGTLLEVKNWIYNKSNCATFGIPANLRVRAFNKLITNDDYWNIALMLLEEIDESDANGISQVVNSLIDNPSSDWLAVLLPQLHDWEGDSEDFIMLRQLFDRFIELCGGQGSNLRFAKTIFTKTIPNEINPLLNEPATFTYNTFQQPIFLAKNTSAKYFGGATGNQIAIHFNNSVPYEVYYEGGKVHVIQNYNIWSASLGMSSTNWTAPETTFNFHHVLNPYEDITVQFLDNYATELGFDAGQNVVIPAYYLLLMTETIDHSDWYSNFRVAMDALEIVGGTLAFISAPLTAGGSLALVGAIVAATDIEVQQHRLNSTNAEAEAFQTWDKFYTAIQLLTIAPTGYTLLSSVSQSGSFSRVIVSFKSLRKKLNQMPSNIKASLVYLRNVWNGTNVVNIIPPSLANKLGNTSNLQAWLTKNANDLGDATPMMNQLDNSIGTRNVLESLEDAQGRFVTVIERPNASNLVTVMQKNHTGNYVLVEFSPGYNSLLNPSIPVPVSFNKLVPDYIATGYMHPLQGGTTVKIKMAGNRSADFTRCRQKLGITLAEEQNALYTWHHMDDFEIINGEAYCTMQLVEKSAHQGTGVLGMQHSGSAAQWRAYYGSGY